MTDNQFFAVQAAQRRIKDGEGGIIWNTQGSGKSLIMEKRVYSSFQAAMTNHYQGYDVN